MPRPDTESFNKEKFVFLLTSCVFAAGLFLYLSSGPVSLQVGKPLSAQPEPVAADNRNMDTLQPEESYVFGPKRARKSPFTPAEFRQAKIVPKGPVTTGILPPPPPPPEPVKVAPTPKKSFDPKDLNIEVEYMGVVMMQDKTYGVVRPKDGSSPRYVKVGDTIEQYKYKITKIEKQAIWAVDEEERPFILRNSRFSGDAVAAAPEDDAPAKQPTIQHKTPTDPKPPAPKQAPQPAPQSTPPTSQRPGPQAQPGNKTSTDRPVRQRRQRPGAGIETKQKAE